MNLGFLVTKSGERPEQRLADMMTCHLLVSIDPAALRRFIKDHWSKVSMLAHQIHDEADRYALLPAGDG